MNTPHHCIVTRTHAHTHTHTRTHARAHTHTHTHTHTHIYYTTLATGALYNNQGSNIHSIDHTIINERKQTRTQRHAWWAPKRKKAAYTPHKNLCT